MSKELLNECLGLFQEAQKGRDEFDQKRMRIDEALEPWHDDEENGDFRAPHVHHQIETLSANMIDPDPRLRVEPREYTDEQNAKLLSAAANYYLERCRFAETLADWVRLGNRYGKSLVKVVWRHEEREFPVAQDRTIVDKILRRPARVEYEPVVTYDGPDVSLVDLDDFWVQPGAKRLEWAEWVIHRTYIPKDALDEREEAGVYQNTGDVKAGIPVDDAQRTDFLDTEGGSDAESKKDLVELLEVWWKSRGRLIVIANRKTIVRDDPWPYRHGEYPFVDYTPIKDASRFWGVSPVEPLIPVQRAIWDSETQRREAVGIAMNPTLLVKRSLKKGNDFKITMGGRIFVDRMDDIVPLRIDVNAAQGWDEIQGMLGYMQQISGVSPFIAGADPSQYGINQNTATGVNQLAGAAGKRVGYHIFNLQRAVARVGDLIVQLLQQFMDDSMMVRIVGEEGEEWVRVSRDQIMFQFDCVVAGDTEEWSKQQRRQQDIELLNVIAQYQGMPMADGTQVDVAPALRRAVEGYGLDPDLFFKPMDQMQVAQQQAELEQGFASADQMRAQAEASLAQAEQPGDELGAMGW